MNMKAIMPRQCKRCDHQWIPRVETTPKKCPRCKSYLWQKEPRQKKAAA
jgi:predicted Zn-ribbon and HTH transcriptional regulator